mmetsp:Transcript_90047/g.250139  ORF Transcript_90047/g.250139 Transcript_90047/m.250139 type:complete len:546 (-) Transcript_90047:198-1835(-)
MQPAVGAAAGVEAKAALALAEAQINEGSEAIRQAYRHGRREDLKLRADKAVREGVWLVVRQVEVEYARRREGPLADLVHQVLNEHHAVGTVPVVHGPHEVDDLEERLPQYAVGGRRLVARLRVQQDRRHRGGQVAVCAGVGGAAVAARSERIGHVADVGPRRVRRGHALDEAVADEDGRVLVPEEVVQETLDLCQGSPGIGGLARHEDGRVPECVAPDDHHGLLVLEELAAVLKDSVFLVDGANGRVGFYFPVATSGAGDGWRERADLEPRQKLRRARDLRERAPGLDTHDAGAGPAGHQAPLGARAVGHDWEATVKPGHGEAVLSRLARQVGGHLAVGPDDDVVAAGIGRPHGRVVVTAAVPLEPLIAHLEAQAGTTLLRRREGHTLLGVAADPLAAPGAGRAVVALVAGAALPAGELAILPVGPPLVVPAPLGEHLWVRVGRILARVAVAGHPPVRCVLAAAAASSARHRQVRVLTRPPPFPGPAPVGGNTAVEEEEVHTHRRHVLVESARDVHNAHRSHRALLAVARKPGVEFHGELVLAAR